MPEQETSKQETADKKINRLISHLKKNPWMISTIVLGIILIIFIISPGGFSGIGKDKATNKLVEYLNSKVGGGVSLLSSEDLGDMYEVIVSYQGNEIPVYITKDGDYFIQGAVPITNQETDQQEPQAQEIPKSEKPKVELYVMSFCPYGNRAEDTMLSAYNLLKNKIDFNVYYIVSVSGSTVQSLHGQPEVDQNEREACVLKNNGWDKWWKFVTYVNENCGSDGSCWKDAAKDAGVTESSISSCVSSDGLTLMEESEAASNSAGASGSPTLIINGVQSNSVYQYGNSEAYKQAICSAFTTSPEECVESLSGSTSTSTASTGGSC